MKSKRTTRRHSAASSQDNKSVSAAIQQVLPRRYRCPGKATSFSTQVSQPVPMVMAV